MIKSKINGKTSNKTKALRHGGPSSRTARRHQPRSRAGDLSKTASPAPLPPTSILAHPGPIAVNPIMDPNADADSQFDYNFIQPWERQPQESSHAYNMFCMYRDMPPSERSYKALILALGKSKNNKHIHLFGSDHKWVPRAAAWDFHIERARLAATETYQVEMAMRHAEISKSMLDKLTERIRTIDIRLLGPKEIAQWLDIGVKVERLSRGLQSDDVTHVSINQTNNVLTLSDQEIMSALANEGIRTSRGTTKVLNAAPSN